MSLANPIRCLLASATLCCAVAQGLAQGTVTFDDDAANILPDANSEFPASGSQSYKPSGSLTLASPQPAPNPTHSTLGEAFGGQDPNGPWRLYIIDDTTGPCSTLPAEIQSWSLTFTP